MSKNYLKHLVSSIAIAILSAAYVLWFQRPTEATPPVSPTETPRSSAITADGMVETNASVIRVVDGDTIVANVDGVGEATIRLLGVNTPETVDPRRPVECFGKEASAFTHGSMPPQDRIRLEADPKADEVDRYGRLLRNIVLADGTDFNAMLVREGYAYAYLSFPLDPERKRDLSVLQEQAKQAERGLWDPTICHDSKG